MARAGLCTVTENHEACFSSREYTLLRTIQMSSQFFPSFDLRGLRILGVILGGRETIRAVASIIDGNETRTHQSNGVADSAPRLVEA